MFKVVTLNKWVAVKLDKCDKRKIFTINFMRDECSLQGYNTYGNMRFTITKFYAKVLCVAVQIKKSNSDNVCCIFEIDTH